MALQSLGFGPWHDENMKDQNEMADFRDCDDIGGRLKLIEQSMAALGAKVDKLVGENALNVSARDCAMQKEMHDVATRVERVELLLFQTPLPDFKVLDDAIATLIPRAQATAQFSVNEVSDIKDLASREKASQKNAVNISINPEFIDQFCIDEADADTVNAGAEPSPEPSPVDRLGPPRGFLCKQSTEDSVSAGGRCEALRCSEGHEMSLESTKWYTCPCCYTLSCSLSCYHSHRKKCAKHFDRQQVEEHEPQRTVEQVAPLSRLDCSDLQDLENSDDGEEDELGAEELGDGQLEELAARVESGDLDIEDLTDGEARSLQVQLKSSSLVSSLDSWRPWWQQQAMVEDVDSDSKANADGRNKAIVDGRKWSSAKATVATAGATRASALKPPAHICCAGCTKPHASVALTTLSAIYAYVHTMRSFNGGWEWAPLEAAPHLLHLSPVICSHQVYSSAEECLRSSLEAAATPALEGFGADFDLSCLADACALICSGADYCACALQDIVEIFEACLAGGGRGFSKKLRQGMKKLEFLTSFAFHHYQLLQPLAAVANDYIRERRVQTRQESKSDRNFAS